MAADAVSAAPSGRHLGYVYESILAAGEEIQALKELWEADAPVATMANNASAIEDRFTELRAKLYNLANALDG